MKRLTDVQVAALVQNFQNPNSSFQEQVLAALLELQARRKQDAIAVEMLVALKEARERIVLYRIEQCEWLRVNYPDWAKTNFPDGDPWLLGIDAAIQRAEEAGYGK